MSLADTPPPYGTVVFDCDSTLSRIEGIEELSGARRGEIARMTADAMDGALPLEEVYGRRLDLVQPSRANLLAVGERYAEELVHNAHPCLEALATLGKRAVIVSGGLLPAVACLGRHLGLAEADVFAVGVTFNADGSYADFDRTSPLARAGGKIGIVASLAAEAASGPVCLVGDGVTDLEAAGSAARFVAFGGVERRAAVFEEAAVTCAEADFAALAPLLFSDDELCVLRGEPRFASFTRDIERYA
ncbi:MAG: haloacid dehalogenase [Planctomycetes bacterium]|nr:haloacid dehalogenase [Planctomycetota bacterium]MDP6409133.1 HAD-IB family phosphatase [Planctomycetota bacterium]